MKNLSVFIALFCLTAACSEGILQDVPNAEKAPQLAPIIDKEVTGEYKERYNLKYGDHPFQIYDLYQPVLVDDSAKSVLVVLIHGGGWGLLDKLFMEPYIQQIKASGKNLAMMNINHRLVEKDKVGYPELMEDIDLLLDHISVKKEDYKLSGDVVFLGYSSGGHIALSYAYEHPNRKEIKAVSAIAAPADLSFKDVQENIYDRNKGYLTEILVGLPFEQAPRAYQEASPYYKVNNLTCPSVLFYGQNDEILEQPHGSNLYVQLTRKRVEARFILYPGIGHDMEGKHQDIVAKSIAFFAKR